MAVMRSPDWKVKVADAMVASWQPTKVGSVDVLTHLQCGPCHWGTSWAEFEKIASRDKDGRRLMHGEISTALPWKEQGFQQMVPCWSLQAAMQHGI